MAMVSQDIGGGQLSLTFEAALTLTFAASQRPQGHNLVIKGCRKNFAEPKAETNARGPKGHGWRHAPTLCLGRIFLLWVYRGIPSPPRSSPFSPFPRCELQGLEEQNILSFREKRILLIQYLDQFSIRGWRSGVGGSPGSGDPRALGGLCCHNNKQKIGSLGKASVVSTATAMC